MASLQEPGTVVIYRRTPDGRKDPLLDMRVEVLAPSGGAPDAAAASVVTPEKRVVIGTVPVTLEIDDILELSFTADGADGIDVSDSIWQIPMTDSYGKVFYLSQGQFANPAAADYTTVAATEKTVAGWRATRRSRLGGGPIYIDIQDDTA